MQRFVRRLLLPWLERLPEIAQHSSSAATTPRASCPSPSLPPSSCLQVLVLVQNPRAFPGYREPDRPKVGGRLHVEGTAWVHGVCSTGTAARLMFKAICQPATIAATLEMHSIFLSPIHPAARPLASASGDLARRLGVPLRRGAPHAPGLLSLRPRSALQVWALGWLQGFAAGWLCGSLLRC